MNLQEHIPMRVGPAGWAYADWKGVVYPATMPRGQHALEWLSAYFDLVEINVSFYRPIPPAHAAAWLRHTAGNPQFMFTAKLWDRFSHRRETWPSLDDIHLFRAGMTPLADAGKLGALLVQFPWSFRRTTENRLWLARVTEAFEAYRLCVEFRHDSWECPEVLDGFTQRGIAVCNIDQPLFDHSIAPAEHVTAPFAYIRLHGRNHKAWFQEGAGRDARYDYLYNGGELGPWLDRINRMKNRINDLFIVTNNHYRGQAIVNALEIQAALGKTHATLPEELLAVYPRLRRLLRNTKEPRMPNAEKV